MSRARWLGATAICLFAAGSVIPLYTLVVQNTARTAIRNASILCRTRKAASASEVQALYKGQLNQLPGCTSASCGYEAVVNNSFLAALHWTPYSEIRSHIWVENGVVVSVILDFTSTANPAGTVVSHLYVQGHAEENYPEFTLHPWMESSPANTNGIVGVSPESLRQHGQTVLAFDVTCLTRHHGCPTIADLLPTVWEHARNGVIRCRLANRKGFIEGPEWLSDAVGRP